MIYLTNKARLHRPFILILLFCTGYLGCNHSSRRNSKEFTSISNQNKKSTLPSASKLEKRRAFIENTDTFLLFSAEKNQLIKISGPDATSLNLAPKLTPKKLTFADEKGNGTSIIQGPTGSTHPDIALSPTGVLEVAKGAEKRLLKQISNSLDESASTKPKGILRKSPGEHNASRLETQEKIFIEDANLEAGGIEVKTVRKKFYKIMKNELLEKHEKDNLQDINTIQNRIQTVEQKIKKLNENLRNQSELLNSLNTQESNLNTIAPGAGTPRRAATRKEIDRERANIQKKIKKWSKYLAAAKLVLSVDQAKLTTKLTITDAEYTAIKDLNSYKKIGQAIGFIVEEDIAITQVREFGERHYTLLLNSIEKEDSTKSLRELELMLAAHPRSFQNIKIETYPYLSGDKQRDVTEVMITFIVPANTKPTPTKY